MEPSSKDFVVDHSKRAYRNHRHHERGGDTNKVEAVNLRVFSSASHSSEYSQKTLGRTDGMTQICSGEGNLREEAMRIQERAHRRDLRGYCEDGLE